MRRTVNELRRTCSVLVDLENKFVDDVTIPSQSDTQKRGRLLRLILELSILFLS